MSSIKYPIIHNMHHSNIVLLLNIVILLITMYLIIDYSRYLDIR